MQKFTFSPNYKITDNISNDLIIIESLKGKIDFLPITPHLLLSLKESAKLASTHYSTQIEGNRLSLKEVNETIKLKKKHPLFERDEREIKNYYKAMDIVEKLALKKTKITEKEIQKIHSVLEGEKTLSYREGQNVIKDSATGYIVYMPPEAKDVPFLMKSLIDWLNNAVNIPVIIRAGIAHYQFVTIHPFYDGNGRTARLFTSLFIHRNGYGMKGIYSLEEYYSQNLDKYYNNLSLGPSHNYYFGRAEADITCWIEYFTAGVRYCLESVYEKAAKEADKEDVSIFFQELDAKQKKVYIYLKQYGRAASQQLSEVLGLSVFSCRDILRKWVKSGFLAFADNSKKNRKYKLNNINYSIAEK